MQRNERNKLKERLLKAKQEVSQLQMQVIIECAHCLDNRGGHGDIVGLVAAASPIIGWINESWRLPKQDCQAARRAHQTT